MDLDVLTPIGLGLLGFLEPCSLGANAVFLRYILPLSGWQRGLERLSVWQPLVPYLTGGILILIGSYGIVSGWRG